MIFKKSLLVLIIVSITLALNSDHVHENELFHLNSDDGHSVMAKPNETVLNSGIAEVIDNTLKVGHEVALTFNEEINRLKNISSPNDTTGQLKKPEARDIWLSYGFAVERVMDSVLQQALPMVMESAMDMNVSTDCMTTLINAITALRQQKPWIIKMLDASGRPLSSGYMDGTVTEFGNYDGCLDLKVAKDNKDDPDVNGQYCIVKYTFPIPPKPKILNLQTKLFNFTGTKLEGTFLEEMSNYAHVFYDRFARIGICTPSSCSRRDIQELIDSFLKYSYLNPQVDPCEVYHGFDFDGVQIFIITVLGSLAALILLSTLIDLLTQLKKKETHFGSIRSILNFFKSFSIYKNCCELMDTNRAPGNFDAINGIRVLSMAWILLTHTYLIPLKETFSFARHFIYTVEHLWFQLIVNGWVLVDSFFFVGAMLATYTQLRSIQNNDGRVNFVRIIVNRFCRLSPAIWFTVAVILLLPTIGSGPLWHEYLDYQVKKCRSHWWATVLFFNNWMSEENLCLLHTWYLAADFQLFIIALLFLAIFYKRPNLGIKLNIAGIALTALAIMITTFIKNHPPTVLYDTPSETYIVKQATTIYTPTYYHLGPYFIGVLVGFLCHRQKKYHINPVLNLLIWIISIATIIGVLLSTHPLNNGYTWSRLSSALYAGLHRIAWSASVGWITFACATDNGGFVNKFLSWSLFIPLGRLSYMIYLMHFLVLWARYAHLRERLPFSHGTMITEAITNFVLSTICAMMAYLFIEAPASNLYKLYVKDRFQWATIQLHNGKSSRKRKFNPESIGKENGLIVYRL